MLVSNELLSLCKQAARISESFDDELVRIYIRAGLAHYTAYTGRYLEQRRERYVLEMDEKGYVYLPTSPTRGTEVTVHLSSGRRKVLVDYSGQRFIVVPVGLSDAFQLCGPTRVEVEYTIGEKCEDIPANVLAGLMRYVAYCYEHRGDDLAMINQKNNDPLSASGALEEWKQHTPMLMG